jgi:hypothetical protein
VTTRGTAHESTSGLPDFRSGARGRKSPGSPTSTASQVNPPRSPEPRQAGEHVLPPGRRAVAHGSYPDHEVADRTKGLDELEALGDPGGVVTLRLEDEAPPRLGLLETTGDNTSLRPGWATVPADRRPFGRPGGWWLCTRRRPAEPGPRRARGHRCSLRVPLGRLLLACAACWDSKRATSSNVPSALTSRGAQPVVGARFASRSSTASSWARDPSRSPSSTRGPVRPRRSSAVSAARETETLTWLTSTASSPSDS